MQCATCPAQRNGTKFGGGWKNHKDRVWCPDCWRRSYMLRAVTFPVAGPVGFTWKELRAALSACWANSTAAANWVTSVLYAHDIVRTPTMARLPKYPVELPLYQDGRKTFPTMDSRSFSAVLRTVQKKYGKQRYQVVWTRAASLANYRYPVPYPIHNESWTVARKPGGALLLSVYLDGKRRTLRLRGGWDYRRQLKAVRLLLAGEATQGELALYRAKVSANSNRAGFETRAPGGGVRQTTRVMAKLVMWLPKPTSPREKDGTLFLTTGSSTFWHYHLDDSELVRTLHADHRKRAEEIQRSITAHRNRLDRVSDDQKYNRRRSRQSRRWTNERREAWCLKQRHRIETFVHQETKELADIAARCRVARVVYDDTDQSYFESFPWFDLRMKLEYKLDRFGIELVHVGSSSDSDDDEDEDEEEPKTVAKPKPKAASRPPAKKKRAAPPAATS